MNTLIPALREHVNKEMSKFFKVVDKEYNISTNANHSFTKDERFLLNFENKVKHKISSHHELAKLYLEPHIRKQITTITDPSFEASAVLNVIIFCSWFPKSQKELVKELRNVRNQWAHCNFSEWTQLQYQVELIPKSVRH